VAFFIQLLVAGLVVGSVYAMIALGFVLIYKSERVINFAQGELLLVGAYLCLWLTVVVKIPFLLSFLITLMSSVILGFAIERIFLRPMIGEPILSVIMLTIGLSALLRGTAIILWGTDTKVFPEVFPPAPLKLGIVEISQVYVWSLVLSVIFLVIFTLFFKYTDIGIAMRATSDDQTAALSMGISVKRVFAIAWAIAAVVASVGGILLGNINGINLSISQFGLKVFPVVILGGLDSIPGAIVGGFTIGLLESLSSGYLDPLFGGGVREVAPFVILVIVLMIKPYGLFGQERIERV
jgi:branched-chain amino acid transport system permease protein